MVLSKLDPGYQLPLLDSEMASPRATSCDTLPMATPVPPTASPYQLEASLPCDQGGVVSGALADDSEICAEVGMPRSSLAQRKERLGDIAAHESLHQGEDMGSGSVDKGDSVLGEATLMLQDLLGCSESSAPESSGDWSGLGAGVGNGQPALVTTGDGSDLIRELEAAGCNQGLTNANDEFVLSDADLLETADALLEVFRDGDDPLLGDGTEMTDTGRL